MKKIYILFISLFMLASCQSTEVKNFNALVGRVMPAHGEFIEGRLLKDDPSVDRFTVEQQGDKIVISGNSAGSMAVGLNQYLRQVCKVSYGWFKEEGVDLPATLPAVEHKIEGKARCNDRFFLNYCTYGYTMPWWKWEDWEHFIDWMAMNGINLPLAITGQESVWYKVWTEMGLSDQTVRDYFTGPAHLPWHRMQNIDCWQGGLPHEWLDGQVELQKRIVERERQLSMRPVLPGFAGHVPAELKEVYPDAKIEKLSAWCNFPDKCVCSFIDPMDSLYTVIQKKFIDKQTELFGTDHIYGIDLFNELTPPSWEPEYLGRVSRQVYESLQQADNDAVWLQMTWLFYNQRNNWTKERVEAYVGSFDAQRQILLDYYCERQQVWQRTDSFFGVPYIWCYLGNFGGNTMLVGDLKTINERIEDTYANGGNNMAGVGSTLEGFDCNPYVYQYVFEKAWDVPTTDVESWVNNLARQRVGNDSEEGRKAWQMLVDSVYTAPSVPGHCSLLSTRPTFGLMKTHYRNARINYHNSYLTEVMKGLLAAKGEGKAYEFDLTNICRQMLGNYYNDLLNDYCVAYQDKDYTTVKEKAEQMTALLDDMERLLETQSYFLMGKWIADARSWGANAEQADYYESNARNILTTWGDRDMVLNDYASRTWAGLTGNFYRTRWTMFFEAVDKSIEQNVPFDEQAYHDEVCDFEKAWWEKRLDTMTAVPVGNSIEVASELTDKYAPMIEARD